MMRRLHTGSLYWPTTLEHTASYPQVNDHLRTKVAIVGGGMSGVVCGYTLTESGIAALVIERGEIAGGSTSANTGLLQFCNDITLTQLTKQIGEQSAVSFYRGCLQAVQDLGAAAAKLTGAAFYPRSSLYYASTESDVAMLVEEYEALREAGLSVELWTEEQIKAHFPFSKPAAIVTHGDAEVNPAKFVTQLAEYATRSGLGIHEHTDIIEHLHDQHEGLHRLRTSSGHVIEAEHVIYAVGYEPEELRGNLIKAEMNRSFAGVTEVQDSELLNSSWHQKWMLWESARPYLYLRTTEDGRIVIGGLDEEYPEPVQGDRSRHKRTDKLEHRLHALFPELNSSLAYEWSATFGESVDGLPFIGKDPERDGVYYCLGYGGNGTVYSMLGSQIIRDAIQGKTHPLASIVRLDR
ncbi:NAD(P)/FAD-dependent oxidoreductase [Paenibacillus sp. GCM10023252]|uniref:NAD(P)/FAD-dependent oxidoreductase n=1 Tax=Paenibacillus sp. GCM10023252 TaxID=3252649 RepID=UPI00361A92A3